MKRLSYFFFSILSLSLVLVSCGDDDEMDITEPTNNLVEIAQANGFNALAAAVTKAGLIDALSGSTDYTVFAPTDEAFANLLATIGQTSVDDVPAAVLEQILLYHVVPGKVFSTDISDGEVNTLEGSTVALGTTSGVTVNGTSVIGPFDVEATNGVVHTIGEVLVPAEVGKFVNSVLEPAYFSESFTSLIAAAAKANVVDALLTTPNLTIFAPDNDAFAAAGINIDAVEADALAAVLTYHVVGAKVMSTEIPREASTLNGNMIHFSLVETGNFINGSIEIKAVDIESGTGVVHVIDEVLFPPTGNLVQTAIALSDGGEFTSLIAALARTADEGTADQNLIDVLGGAGPFTVFAPTNAAFQALLDSNPNWTDLADIPLETLVSVLSYHVVPARAFDKDVKGALDTNNELPTALGQNIRVNVDVMSINDISNIVGVNFNATNGVIHVIDSVLLP